MPPRIVATIPIPIHFVETISVLDQDVFKFGRAYEIPVTIFTEAYANTLWWKLPSYKNASRTRNFRRRRNREWNDKGFLVQRERIQVGDFVIYPGFLPGDIAAIGIEYDGDIVPGSHVDALLKSIIAAIKKTLPEPSGTMPAPKVNFKGLPSSIVNRISEYAKPAPEARIPGLEGGGKRRKTRKHQ